jgi:parvulin-like peptidyl-prolyl isomerase
MRTKLVVAGVVLAALAAAPGRAFGAAAEDPPPPTRTERVEMAPGRIARVNDRWITQAELDEWIRKRTGPRRYTELNALIARTLVGQAADKEKIVVDAAEIDTIARAQLKRIQDERPEASLESSLQYLGVTEKDLRQDILYNLRLRRLIERHYEIEATPTDIRQLYDRKYGPRYFIQQIVVRNAAFADEAKRAVERGDDFALAARRYSIDEASRAFGGFISGGSIVPGDLVAGLEEVALALKPGEVSKVVSLGGDYFIFRMVEKIPPVATAPKFEDAKADVRKEVIERKVMEYARDYLLKLYKTSTVQVSMDF